MNLIWNKIYMQPCHSHLYSIYNLTDHQIWIQLKDQVENQVGDLIRHQIWIQIWDGL